MVNFYECSEIHQTIADAANGDKRQALAADQRGVEAKEFLYITFHQLLYFSYFGK